MKYLVWALSLGVCLGGVGCGTTTIGAESAADTKKDPDPGTNPGTDPKPDPDPGTDPNPGTDPKPDPDPGTDPKPDPDPGTDPKPDPDPGTDPNPGAYQLPSGAHQAIFLHHSVGGNILLEDDHERGVVALYKKLLPNNGLDHERYPDASGLDNRPQAFAQLWVDENKLPNFLSKYDIVIFKHCFTTDEIERAGGQSTGSGHFAQTVPNYKVAYNKLKPKLRSYPNKAFIVWTVAPRPQAARSEPIENSRAFYKWVTEEWDEPGDNIFLFDFRRLATRGNMDYLWPSGASDGEGHINEGFAHMIAPCFAQRIADVSTGQGDKPGANTRTGGCDLSL